MESHGIVYFYFYFNKHTYAEETKQRKRNGWLPKTLKQNKKASVGFSEIVCQKIYYNPSGNLLLWVALKPYLFVVLRLMPIRHLVSKTALLEHGTVLSSTSIYRIFEVATEIIIIKYIFLTYVFRICNVEIIFS